MAGFFENNRGNLVEPVLLGSEGFSRVGRSAWFSVGAHYEGLGSGRADYHDVKGCGVVVVVDERPVSAFQGTVGGGGELFLCVGEHPIDGGSCGACQRWRHVV